MKEKGESGIGVRIAHIRGDMTQAEFAERTGVGRTTVIRYESGDRSPDVVFVCRVITEFGVDPVWLLMGDGEFKQVKLATDEQFLLDHYRAASQQGKNAILGAALGQGGNISQQFNAPVRQMAGRDVRQAEIGP